MIRRRAFAFLTLLTVLLVGFPESVSYGQRYCRGSRQRSSCCRTCDPCLTCNQPCQRYCPPSECYGGCKCINSVIYGYAGNYLHYARRYPDSTICANFTTIIHQDSVKLDATSCDDQNCNLPAKTYCLEEPGLSTAVDPSHDIAAEILAKKFKVKDELHGVVTLAGGAKIHAKILLLKVALDDGVGKKWGWFAFGLETTGLPTGVSDQLQGAHGKKHDRFQYIYECEIGGAKCFLLTVKR